MKYIPAICLLLAEIALIAFGAVLLAENLRMCRGLG